MTSPLIADPIATDSLSHSMRLTVNGQLLDVQVEPRRLLVEFLRVDRGLCGTHSGCDTSSCGACTVLVDGHAAKSCTLLAVQAQDCEVRTVESLAAPNGELHALQQAFHENHALQCGFCTPGMLMAAMDLLSTIPDPTELQIRQAIAGNICRCTGYQNIVIAIQKAALHLAKAKEPS